MDVMPGSDGLRILGFEKQLRFGLRRGRVDFRSSPRRDQFGSTGCPRVCRVSELRADDVRTVSVVSHFVSLSPDVGKLSTQKR